MRVDAYGEIGNDLGQHRTVAGQRGGASRVWARLNTDNAGRSDCALNVSAEVTGERSLDGRVRKTCRGCGRRWDNDWAAAGETCPDCGTLRQGQDTRETTFTVGLPRATTHCEVVLEVGNPALNRLVGIGAMLCAVKGAQEVVNGEPARGKATIENAAKLVAEMEEENRRNLPPVTLPGGVSLAHALACVAIVQDIIGGPGKEN